ncbi:MAG: gliding motility-associated C-terminal domain-containing protein, partial [Bacteroidales bacterium]|nr:gliding motility-associated C-terminal domain-containing protein [Bacteroidales bacterium]
RHGCDSIILLQLTMVELPSVVAHATYDCTQQWYHLTTTTPAPYIIWYAQPADSAELMHSPPDAFARPLTTVAYIVRADLRDTLFCPAYDTLMLQPAQLPSATLSTRPEMLTESSLTLYATAMCHNAQRMHWFVDDRWFDENCANITYHADPLADSVRLAVVVENSLCADTTTRTVPIHHEALYVPNIILPEGDAEELRLFRVRSNTVTEFEMTIYTRGGTPIFHTTDLDTPWDGTSNGTPCPQGAYLYNIRYRVPSVAESWKTRSGTVTLVR